MAMKLTHIRIVYGAVILIVLSAVAFWGSDVAAQRADTPVVGHYPGGHVGLRGGATPPEDTVGVFNFFRYNNAGDLKNANRDTITKTRIVCCLCDRKIEIEAGKELAAIDGQRLSNKDY
jgi:hypothetical protein